MSKKDCGVKLKALLTSVKKKVGVIANNKREIFIFGAGNTSSLYAKSFEVEGIEPAGFLDNDPKKQVTTFQRGGVLSPLALQGRKDVLVLICSTQLNVQAAVSAQLESLGLDCLTVDEYIFTKRMDEILKCVELLDDESAEIYMELIESRLMGYLPSKKFFNRNQYFVLNEFSTRSEKEIFVDCGAFVGDTIEEYISSHEGIFENIIAFEPDAVNFRALQARVERLNKEWALPENKIELVNAGVGSKTTEGILPKHLGLGSRISEQKNSEGDSIKIYALDDYFSTRKINFLKADIESFEFDMLKGAEKIIRRDLPKIAVCIYHNASDMYQILLWLASLNLNYNFSIRHHGTLYSDTVLYAYQ